MPGWKTYNSEIDERESRIHRDRWQMTTMLSIISDMQHKLIVKDGATPETSQVMGNFLHDSSSVAPMGRKIARRTYLLLLRRICTCTQLEIGARRSRGENIAFVKLST